MIGIFGGTFDPVHEGHLSLLRAVLGPFPFTKILVIPSGKNPLKGTGPEATSRQRKEMLQLAISRLGDPRLEIDSRELLQETISFTIDTVLELKKIYHEPLVLLMGNEVFLSLPKWKEPYHLLENCHCLVVRRKGDKPLDFEPTLRGLGFTHFSKKVEYPRRVYHKDNQWVDECPMDRRECSATAIRESLHRDPARQPEGITDGVWNYIKENEIYTVKRLEN